MQETLTIRQPDDWHLHLRDGHMMEQVLPASAVHFARAVVMPNLVPPVTRTAQAVAYRERILKALPEQSRQFQPLMTLYLTENTSAQDIAEAAAHPHIIGVKLYPAGATTHSDAGVADVARVLPVLEAMAGAGLPLLVHGEVVDPEVDIFDREARFVDEVLDKVILRRVPELRLVLEHVSTRHGTAFVQSRESGLAATITPQHLLMNRNAILAGGLRPHNYCLPVLKRERDREALVAAATSGDPRFFLGTDSAPHARVAKESACGCAGTFNAPAALAVYAGVFAEAGRLEALEGFASLHGPRFYGLAPNDTTVTLARRRWQVPDQIGAGAHALVPWLAGEDLDWQVVAS